MRQGIVLLGALAFATACGSKTPQLRPASGANTMPGQGAAMQRNAGVRFVAQSVGWPGETAIQDEVTPLRVIIENRGKQPIAIRYSDFVLADSNDNHYAALPPFQAQGNVIVQPKDHGPLAPGFDSSEFKIAPYLHQVYPQMGVYDEFAADAPYYSTYYAYWENKSLPTADMLSMALPEGVLNPGGHLAGWLYFQKVNDNVEQLDLRAAFADPKTGATVARFELPFEVK